MKLGKTGKSYHIIIPKEIIEEHLQWKQGDKLSLEIQEREGEKILIIKKSRKTHKTYIDKKQKLKN